MGLVPQRLAGGGGQRAGVELAGLQDAVFRVAQEAVRNVAEHAAATAVDIRLESSDGTVELIVADDGVGFDVARLHGTPAEGHVGLLLLRDLVQTAGGTLEFDSAPGQGTRVRLEAPAT